MKKSNIYLETYLKHSISSIPLALTFSIFIADLLCSIGVIIFLRKIIKEKINIFDNFLIKLLFIFWIYLLARSLFTFDFVIITKIFFYIRFILFGSLICFLFSDKKFVLLLKNYLFISLIIVALSAYSELFFKVNYFNTQPTLGRISGIFGDELIIGSYLLRIFPIFIAINLFIFRKRLSSITLFVIVFPIILFSGERTALILFSLIIFLTLIYLSYVKEINLKTFTTTVVSIIILFSLFWQHSSTETKNRVVSISSIEKIKHSYLNYKPAYESSYKIFINNKFFGAGPRNFRNVCSQKENYVKNGCTTHPHNIVLQLLSETGIVGILFYLTIILTLLIKFIKTKNDNNTLIAQKYLIIIILLNFFPFTPSGNFFNNFMNLIYYLPIGLALNLFEKKINFPFFYKY